MTLGKLKQQVSCIMISVSDECNVCVVCVFEGLVGGGDIVTVTAVNAKYSQQSRWIISGWSMVKLLSYFY